MSWSLNRQLLTEIQEAECALVSLEANAKVLNEQAREARNNELKASKLLEALLAERHAREEAARAAAAALQQLDAPQHAVLVTYSFILLLAYKNCVSNLLRPDRPYPILRRKNE